MTNNITLLRESALAAVKTYGDALVASAKQNWPAVRDAITAIEKSDIPESFKSAIGKEICDKMDEIALQMDFMGEAQ